jgi:hypothetical protein
MHNTNLDSKLKITDIVLQQIPKNLNYDLSGRVGPNDLLTKWWFTGRSGGLRLTERGDQAFRLAEIEFYEYEIPAGSISVTYHSFVLQLSKKLNCPYYIDIDVNNKKGKFIIRLYDSRIAMMVSLYGNLKDYLESVKIK